MLKFTAISVPALPSSVAVDAEAIDPNTARTALASDVDNHYLLRYGSLFASTFMQGYGQAVAQAGATLTTTLAGTTTTMPPLSGKDKIVVALGTVGQKWGAAMGETFNKPPTVTLKSGVGIGVLFLNDVAAAK